MLNGEQQDAVSKVRQELQEIKQKATALNREMTRMRQTVHLVDQFLELRRKANVAREQAEVYDDRAKGLLKQIIAAPDSHHQEVINTTLDRLAVELREC